MILTVYFFDVLNILKLIISASQESSPSSVKISSSIESSTQGVSMQLMNLNMKSTFEIC